MCQCSSVMVTTDLSSLLGKQVGNPDSNLEQQSSQLISLAGWFCCHLPGLQKGSWICEFYSLSLSQGAMFVPAFGWQLLTMSTHCACWGHFAQRLNFLPTQQWLCQGTWRCTRAEPGCCTLSGWHILAALPKDVACGRCRGGKLLPDWPDMPPVLLSPESFIHTS